MGNKELETKDLEKVSGGFRFGDPTNLPDDFGALIDRDDIGNYTGCKVYLVDSRTSAGSKYYWGTMQGVKSNIAIIVKVEGMSQKAAENPIATIGKDCEFSTIAFKLYLKNS